jgi:hypothetical protein
VIAAAVLWVVISRAETILRGRVIETLSARFNSRVELSGFHVSLHQGVQVSGEGLKLYGDFDPNTQQPEIQPILAIAEFRFRAGIADLLRSPMHLDRVYLQGLTLNLPAREQRASMKARNGKITIFVDQFICEHAKLVINTLKPGKLPLEFDIASLKMTKIGPSQPLHFDADLTNPKPVGNILSSGLFGPWQADDPRGTPVEGTYLFTNADLGTIKGIAGILSSTGKYKGTLENIVVDGTTDTPDFRIAVSGHPVPLHTNFHAFVDGTNGDTYLQPVRATILGSVIVASGSVVRVKEPAGHRVNLNVFINNGNIQDLLKLGVRTDPPVMTGSTKLNTRFDLMPGDSEVAQRLTLAGTFQISNGHFTSQKIQRKVDGLSMRSQGQPKLAMDNVADNVPSELSGTFDLRNGLLSFSRIDFRVPGADVKLKGKYSLDGDQFDFHGKARMNAKLSHMVSGWKSVLLKPVDPFFSKNGAGTELPVKIIGTKSEPHFGLDFGHKDAEKRTPNRKP